MTKLEQGGEQRRTEEEVCQEFGDFAKAQLEQVLGEPSKQWMSEEDALERIRLKMRQAKAEQSR